MASAAQKAKWDEIHKRERKQFEAIQAATHEQRENSLEDRRFATIPGAMWEGDFGDQFENRVQLEVNKINPAVMRIFNEYRNNRISADFIPMDGEDDEIADLCDGLYRADEADSRAEEAMDNAFDEGVLGGVGAWRLIAEYEDESDEENERQKIRFEPIHDADVSVYWDLDAKMQDKSDANVCYVISSMTHDAFEAEWGEKPTSWDRSDLSTTTWNWCPVDVVYVAEVFRVERVKKEILIFEDVAGEEVRHTQEELDETPAIWGDLEAKGTRFVRKRTVTEKKVRKYIMSGNSVLSDEGYIPGSEIPIVPFYGKRWFVENVEHYTGHVRPCKDVSRLKNMQLSELAELAARSPNEKPIFTPEQVLGHETRWADDNVKNYAYMLVNELEGPQGDTILSGPLGYTKPPAVSPAMAALLQVTEQDISDILGNQEAGEEIMPNVSGKAVELVQNRLDLQSFIYMSNMKKAVKRSGQIWLSMAGDLFVEDGRRMKSIDKQGESSFVTINDAKVLDAETGKIGLKNDISKARLEVSATIGPSSQTKRQASVRAFTGMMQITADPETQLVLGSLALMNMEGEGIEDVREWNRKRLVSMGVLQPNEQDKAEAAEAQANAQPDPNVVLMQAVADKERAQAGKYQKDAEKVDAEIGEIRADTIKKLSEVEREERAAAVSGAAALAPQGTRQPTLPSTNG